MLCPTGAMTAVFDLLPSAMLWPSYRTLMALFVPFVGLPISYVYMIVARFLGGVKLSYNPYRKISKSQ
jgi:hypothetical protein